MRGMDGLKFLQDRQTRQLYGFLVIVCILQAFFLGICGVRQSVSCWTFSLFFIIMDTDPF